MARYTGPKVKISRRLGVNIYENDKGSKALNKRPYPPGEHGRTKRKADSDYAVRLREKQRLRERPQANVARAVDAPESPRERGREKRPDIDPVQQRERGDERELVARRHRAHGRAPGGGGAGGGRRGLGGPPRHHAVRAVQPRRRRRLRVVAGPAGRARRGPPVRLGRGDPPPARTSARRRKRSSRARAPFWGHWRTWLRSSWRGERPTRGPTSSRSGPWSTRWRRAGRLRREAAQARPWPTPSPCRWRDRPRPG